MATPRHTYRYGLDDVEVSLGRVEELLRTHPNPEPLAVSLGRPGDLVADGWNLKVLVEELRAQIEENPGPVPRPNDPVVASALEGLEAWLDETGAGPADRLMISSGHQGAAVFMVSTTFSIAAGVLSEVLRKATVGNRPTSSPGSTEVHVTVTPEVDREVLGDLASDLAEDVAARLLDRLPVIDSPELRLALGQLRELVTYLEGIDS